MYHFIVNPSSKSGKGLLLWNSLEPVIKELNIEYEVYFSQHAGHVITLAKEVFDKSANDVSSEIPKIIVLGGDGTINEALQGIPDFSCVEIGYIPTGSSNDLARDLKIPNDPVKALKNILSCTTPVKMDIGVLEFNNISKEYSRQHEENIITKRYFDVSCGIGYDAAVCEEALTSPTKKTLNKIGLGKLVYLLIALKQLLTTNGKGCKMILDDQTEINMNGFLFAATMVHQYEGGGFKFCPDADYTDGVFDICTASDIGKFAIIRALPSALKGKHFKFNGLDKYSAKKVHIETEVPLWVHTDGEVTMKSNSITLTCEKETLSFLM